MATASSIPKTYISHKVQYKSVILGGEYSFEIFVILPTVSEERNDLDLPIDRLFSCENKARTLYSFFGVLAEML